MYFLIHFVLFLFRVTSFLDRDDFPVDECISHFANCSLINPSERGFGNAHRFSSLHDI